MRFEALPRDHPHAKETLKSLIFWPDWNVQVPLAENPWSLEDWACIVVEPKPLPADCMSSVHPKAAITGKEDP